MTLQERNRLQLAFKEGRRICGTYKELALKVGLCRQHLLKYRNGEIQLSLEHALQFEKVTGIPFWHLRPDLKDFLINYIKDYREKGDLSESSDEQESQSPPAFYKHLDALQINRIIVGKRRHPALQDVEQIKHSMTTVGQLRPIVVSHDGRLILGEGRLMAARELGWKTLRAIVLNVRMLWEGHRSLSEIGMEFNTLERFQVADYLYRYCRHWQKNATTVELGEMDDRFFASNKDRYLYQKWIAEPQECANRVDAYIAYLAALGGRTNLTLLRCIMRKGCSLLHILLEDNLITINLSYSLCQFPDTYQENLLSLCDVDKIIAKIQRLKRNQRQSKLSIN